MCAECSDGHGGEAFYRQLAEATSPQLLLRQIESVPQEATMADQWQTQILTRILNNHKVIMVSEQAQEGVIQKMHMEFAATLQQAVKMAKEYAGTEARYTVIPDGVSVIA